MNDSVKPDRTWIYLLGGKLQAGAERGLYEAASRRGDWTLAGRSVNLRGQLEGRSLRLTASQEAGSGKPAHPVLYLAETERGFVDYRVRAACLFEMTRALRSRNLDSRPSGA